MAPEELAPSSHRGNHRGRRRSQHDMPTKVLPNAQTLTDVLVRSLAPAERGQYAVRDAQLPGFRIVIGTRAKTYAVQVDVWNAGKRRTVHKVLGRAEQLTAKEARAAAKRKIGELQSGALRPPAGRVPTLREAWAAYQAILERKKRQPKTISSYQQALDLWLEEWLDTTLERITPELVQARHATIGRRSGPYAANRAMTTLRAIWNHARRSPRLQLPVADVVCLVEWFPEERRQTGMGSEQLPAWWAELQALPNPVRREFHLFTLLSGSRPDPLRRAGWPHLDVKRRALHFPDPKGGPRRAFDMPMSRAMLACLARVRRAGRRLHPEHAHEYIFPSAVGCIAETKEDRDVLSKWGNDLRQSYRTLAVEADIGETDIKLLMNHKLPGVSGGYVTTSALFKHLRSQQEKLSRFILAALRGPANPSRTRRK
jgi:integrase